MKKNVASQVIGVGMVSATDGSAFTGAVTVAVTGDAGTQATGSVGSGACTHEGNGYHTYAPAQAETNYDQIGFTFTGTGAVPRTVTVYTSFPQTGDNFARIGAPVGASISADVAAVKSQTAAIETDTQDIQSRLPAALVSGRIDASAGAVANNAITASAIAADAITAAKIADGAIDAATFAAGAINAAAVANGAIDAATLAADVKTFIAESVWDALLASYNDADSFGEFVQAISAGGGDATAANQTLILNAVAALPQDKNGYRLSSTGVDDVHDEAIGDSTITLRQALRVILAAAAGKGSGLESTAVAYRNVADSKNVIEATVDADGNRTAVTLDP